MTRTILNASLLCTLLVVVLPATTIRGEEPASARRGSPTPPQPPTAGLPC